MSAGHGRGEPVPGFSQSDYTHLKRIGGTASQRLRLYALPTGPREFVLSELLDLEVQALDGWVYDDVTREEANATVRQELDTLLDAVEAALL